MSGYCRGLLLFETSFRACDKDRPAEIRRRPGGPGRHINWPPLAAPLTAIEESRCGPPGPAKIVLYSAAINSFAIMPPLTSQEALKSMHFHSVAGLLPTVTGMLSERPSRAPHHTVSDAGLIGGGSGMPHPGEVSVAYNGSCFSTSFRSFHATFSRSSGSPWRIARSPWREAT